MWDLKQSAFDELLEIRRRCITAGTKKERAQAVKDLLPFLEAIKKCEYPKREGLTLDGWCRNKLGVPLATLHSARHSQLIDTFGFFRWMLPVCDRDETSDEKQMTSTFC